MNNMHSEMPLTSLDAYNLLRNGTPRVTLIA